MPPKKTATKEQIKELYDPNYFYDHGSNPALKKFMEITVENNKEGKLLDHRTYVVDRYTKLFYARNWDDFLHRDVKAFTFPRAFAVWTAATMFQCLIGKWARGMLPLGQHGIKKFSQTQLYHLYGPPAVVGVLGVYFGSLFLWYKTSAFMSKKFYRHVLLGERQWAYEQEKQTAGHGEYYFNDSPFAADENLSDLARGEMAKKTWDKPEYR